jgi:ASC-1-like (ASCH) protein
VFRDDIYIKNMAGEIDRFNDELEAMVENIRNYDRRSEILKNQLVKSVMGG